MKKLLIIPFLFLSSGWVNAQWELRYPDLPEDKVTDTDFISDSVGFFVNEAGAIYKSTNGGKSWERKHYQDGVCYTDIQFIDERNGFAWAHIGSGFTFTTDGGETWMEDDLDVHLANSLIAFSTSYFLKADDDGIYKANSVFNYWEKVYEVPKVLIDGGDLYWEERLAKTESMQKLDDSTLVALVYNWYRDEYLSISDSLSYLLISNDKGNTWDSVWVNTDSKIRSLQFKKEGIGYFLTDNNRVFKSTDRGLNWVETTPIERIDNISEFYVYNKDRVYIRGSEKILFTNDGGQTWSSIRVPEGYYYQPEISKFDISAYKDLILKINEVGEEWIKGRQYETLQGSRIYFKNKYIGWTFTNTTYKTDDGGYTWTVDDTFPERPNEIKFINDKVGWFFGSDGFYSSIDSGKTWKEVDIFKKKGHFYTTRILFNGKYGVTYINTNCSELSCGQMAVTDDSGSTWTTKEVPTYFKDLSASKKFIYGISSDKKLWFSDNFGDSWKISYDFSYENVSPNQHIRVVDNNVWLNISPTVLAYSFDGGITWKTTSKAEHQLTKDMELIGPYYDGSTDLYLMGGNGTIQKINSDLGTYDKKRENPFTRTHFEDLTYVIDDRNEVHIWVKSIYNTVLYRKGFRVVEVSNEEVKATVPIKTTLNQNYPNPFNPETTISFSLSKPGFTELEVYNLLGQKVATIQKNVLTTGNHSIQFNATKLSSGTYIYQLKVNGEIHTKKFTLIK